MRRGTTSSRRAVGIALSLLGAAGGLRAAQDRPPAAADQPSLSVAASRAAKTATVRVTVRGLSVVDPALPNPAARGQQGHLHYRLDNGSVLCTASTTMVYRDLSPGPHEILVALVNNEHKPLGPEQIVKANQPFDFKDVPSRSPDLGVLKSIPYLQSFRDPSSEAGVTVHREDKSHGGLNLYSSRDDSTFILMDMKGRPLHRWAIPSPGERNYWSWARLLADGSLIALLNDERLVKVDKDSQPVWTFNARVHHDISVDDAGNVYTLTATPRIIRAIHPRRPTLADSIVILTADGVKRDEIPLVELIRDSAYRFLLPSLGELTLSGQSSALDVIHANTVQVFDGRLAAKNRIFAKGNILTCMRNINAVVIIDGKSKQILWLWGPTNLVYPHNPVLLESGNILLFNNGTDKSEVLEIDPLSYEVVWRFTDKDFFSISRGRVQRLPNGNTLITSNSQGYAIEVTPEREVVWRFVNPDLRPDGDRGVLSTMFRYSLKELTFAR